jgi:hypothetical protein
VDATGSPFTAADRDALVRRLYAEDGRALLHFITDLCAGDRHRAEDIVQETMLRAWRNAEALATSGRPSLRPWLFTVARRLAIDAHRLRGARAAEVIAYRSRHRLITTTPSAPCRPGRSCWPRSASYRPPTSGDVQGRHRRRRRRGSSAPQHSVKRAGDALDRCVGVGIELL